MISLSLNKHAAMKRYYMDDSDGIITNRPKYIPKKKSFNMKQIYNIDIINKKESYYLFLILIFGNNIPYK
ncbi:hypothetical protein D3L74_18160 [Salmonella enterica]|nr:hypothetical protein [Salmonella enterica]EBN9597767.1 hypothetical protein [Salmonella enterica]ECV4109270.1 hypothetical protein [Salmonella enterica subsp. enterica serovar Oranienburg]